MKVWGYPRNFLFTLRSLLMGRYDPATPVLVEASTALCLQEELYVGPQGCPEPI